MNGVIFQNQSVKKENVFEKKQTCILLRELGIRASSKYIRDNPDLVMFDAAKAFKQLIKANRVNGQANELAYYYTNIWNIIRARLKGKPSISTEVKMGKCDFCSKEIKVRERKDRESEKRFCSPACRQKVFQKTILQIDPITNSIVKTWPSIKEAAIGAGLKGTRCINYVLSGKYETAGGFIWKLA